MTEDKEKQAPQTEEIHRDAEGQFAPKQAGGKNDGVADAKPRVIIEGEDSTIHYLPPGHEQKDRRDDD